MSIFKSACAVSPDNRHKPVRLYPDPPHIGCLHCRLRNTFAKVEPARMYDLLISSGVTAVEACRRSGYVPTGRKAPKVNMRGAQGAKTGIPVEVGQ